MAFIIDFYYFKDKDITEFFELNIHNDSKKARKIRNIENKLNNGYYKNTLDIDSFYDYIDGNFKVITKNKGFKDISDSMIDELIKMENLIEALYDDLYLLQNYSSEIPVYKKKELDDLLEMFGIYYLPNGENKISIKVNVSYKSFLGSFFENEYSDEITYKVLSKKIERV